MAIHQQRNNVLRICWLGLVLCATLAQAAIVPTRTHTLNRRDELANGVLLKVLPLGDSITRGSGSSKTNGYRGPLHTLLEEDYDNDIDFVGTLSDGTMQDSQHQGHRGYTIKQILNAPPNGVYEEGNIVLLHAGTNNMKGDSDADKAPDQLRDLIDHVYGAWESAVIILAKIIPAKTDGFAPRISKFNEAVEEIYNEYKGDHEMLLVDMHTAFMEEGDWESLMKDDLHPNDKGYDIMARVWFDAIKDASEQGMIRKSGDGTTPPTGTGSQACRESPSWYNWGQIAMGPSTATDDGLLEPDFGEKNIVKAGECDRDWVRFLDLDGDGLKDYACLDQKNGSMRVWLNDYKNSGGWTEIEGLVADGDEDREGKRIMFADINGDGRDDYIFLNPRSGNVEAWINEKQNDDNKWMWNWIGVISEGFDLEPEQLRMGDIDGDGRDDFLVVDEKTGAVQAWFNNGAGDKPDYYKFGEIASGRTATENDKVVFADLTGSGRVDYILVGESGKAVGIVNRLQGKSLQPRWLEAVTLFEGPDSDDVDQDSIHFADITGDGRADYLFIGPKGSVERYENKGTGVDTKRAMGLSCVTSLTACICLSGVVDGDGVADYFWINENGQGWGYLNRGNGVEDSWQYIGNIARGTHDREEIRMGVLTDSKRADYIVVNKDSGRAKWYENLGEDSNGEYQFAERNYIADGPAETIGKTFGMHWNAKNVRFADLDNDGLDDYVYVDDHGAVVWWRFRGANADPILAAPVKVADGVGVRASQVWFADTDGDTLLDYVVVSRITGATTTYLNLGFRGPDATDGAPGSIRWDTPRSFADGVAGLEGDPVGKVPGRSVRLAEMTGDNRWDYVVVGPDQGTLLHWQNRCPDYYPEDPPDGKPGCRWDSKDPRAWEASGAAKLTDDFIAGRGLEEKDWLGAMDQEYYLNSTDSPTIDCQGLESNNCILIQDETGCSGLDETAYWYVRAMASSTHQIFNLMYNSLIAGTLANLASVGDMIDDFDTEEPDSDTLTQVFSTLAAVAGIAASIATAGGAAAAANAFTFAGAAISLTGANMPSGDMDDLDDVDNKISVYIGDILKGGAKVIRDALAGIFGSDREDAQDAIKGIRKQLIDSELIDAGDWKTIQGQIFNGGGFMDPDDGDIAEAMSNTGERLSHAVLGHLLASMKYIVVNPLIPDRDACDFFKSARMVEDECLYLVRLPREQLVSESVPDDIIDTIENKYNVNLDALLKSARDCDNYKKDDDDNQDVVEAISKDRDSYPKCFLGLGYAKASKENVGYPFVEAANKDDLPDWVDERNTWDEGLEKACELKSWQDTEPCKNFNT